jgi:Bifunctional DNA primase/polymerase, N-terminal
MPIVERVSSRSKPSLDLLATALGYAARGWSIIAVKGKKAAGLWKPFQTRTADEPTLRRMFERQATGLAVILGPVSGGLACRDFDDAGAYHRWTAQHPDLAASVPTVKTARGFHVYFRGLEGFQTLGDGEYRADAGHYCLLPPSRHPDGPTYTWLKPIPDGNLPFLDPVQAGLLSGS